MSDDQIKAVEEAIKEFPFWDYGLNDVDPKSEYAEWVPELARAAVEAVRESNRKGMTASLNGAFERMLRAQIAGDQS